MWIINHYHLSSFVCTYITAYLQSFCHHDHSSHHWHLTLPALGRVRALENLLWRICRNRCTRQKLKLWWVNEYAFTSWLKNYLHWIRQESIKMTCNVSFWWTCDEVTWLKHCNYCAVGMMKHRPLSWVELSWIFAKTRLLSKPNMEFSKSNVIMSSLNYFVLKGVDKLSSKNHV